MEYVINGNPGTGRGTKEWKVNVPVLKKPPIFGKKKVDGVMYYRGQGKKLYEIEAFDRMFKVEKGIVKPKVQGRNRPIVID